MSYIMRHARKDGSIKTERRHTNGRVEVLGVVRSVETTNKQDGYWQRSTANGVVPHKGEIKKAMALDKRLGAPAIDYDKHGRACFRSAAEKRLWLRAHKRYDADAGYRDPCPGDFRKDCPPEFEETTGPSVEQVREGIRESVGRAWSEAGGNPFRER